MSGNYERLPIQRSNNDLAKTRAAEAIQQTGRALPCTVTAVDGALVTVSFEVNSQWTLPPLTLPKAESQWLRAPVQVGDVGLTVPADTFLGGISGHGSGIADVRVNYGNLSTLVWVPVAAVSFQATPDPDKAWVNGPNGAALSDSTQTVGVTCDKRIGIVTIYAGDQMIVLTANPSIVMTVTTATNPIQIVANGTAATLSHIVPDGGYVAVGTDASTLLATNAAVAHRDLKSLSDGPNGIVNQTLVNLMGAVATAAASTLTGGPAFAAIIGAANFVSGIAGILPTIPDGSSKVRIAP